MNEFVETLLDLQWHEPKSSYDVVIVGGGGHGLATAYYLAVRHGITNVAVVEANYIGSGNSGRNTTIIRANYGIPESIPAGKGAMVASASSIEAGSNAASTGAPTSSWSALTSCASAVCCWATSDWAVKSTCSAWRRSVRGAMPPSRRARVRSTEVCALFSVSSAISSRLRSAASVSQASAILATSASRVARAAASVARY